MARFTNQKPFTVTDKDLRASWSGGKNGIFFRCGLCGYRFQIGDTARWVFTNNVPGAPGNPLVCQRCDGDDVIDRWKAKWKVFESSEWWWFRRQGIE